MTDDEVLKAIADVESVKHRPTVDELARRSRSTAMNSPNTSRGW